MHALWLTLLLAAAPSPAIDTVLVCPDSWHGAMTPWVELRQSQGHGIVRISSRGTSAEIRQRIREVAKWHPLRYVMLVGDVMPTAPVGAAPIWSLPSWAVPAKVNIHWGSEPEIATDNPYADLDDDGVPELAIGRLTAHSREELETMVRKILVHEDPETAPVSRREINFVAGASGFGLLADAALESAARSILCDHVPPAYSTSMTYASWRSPYCPDPASFRETTLERLNEGCLFWVYMGHAQHRSVDWLQVGKRRYPVLESGDAARLTPSPNAPIALFLACYVGAFDAPDGCLAEELLRAPGGPVAVVAGSRVTMPYAMSVLGTEMLDDCFRQRRETLGEVLLTAKRNSLLKSRDDPRSKFMDSLATLLNPLGKDLAAERAEHVQLFNLLGDPLLRIRQPHEVHVRTAATVMAGGQLNVTGTAPADGEAVVELVVRRDRLTFTPTQRSNYDLSDDARAEIQRQYAQANDPRLSTVQVPVTGGKFSVKLKVPDQATGACHVRVLVCSPAACAVGSADVSITARERGPEATVARPPSAAR